MVSPINNLIKIVEDKTGISIESIGLATLKKAVESQMKDLKIDSLEGYYDKITNSQDDFQNLVELIIVPETWFFRDKFSYEFLDNYARKHFKGSKKRIRILSAPCSTGEEAYSIAITLLNAGFDIGSFKIDAVDISNEVLKKAKIGSYGSYSFRNQHNNPMLLSYFNQHNSTYQIKPEIVKSVRFIRGNILEAIDADGLGAYDIIFCRNLFIYLTPNAQSDLIKVIDKLLLKNGILIVAPSEIECVRKFGFKAFSDSRSCAFQRSFSEKKMKSHGLKRVTAGKVRLINHSLEKAKQYADEGEFEKAKIVCIKHLKDEGPDPLAYYLLGLIEHASGREEEAEKYMLKTIYLEPCYYEAIIYLALLLEKKGEFAHAKIYYNRAKKIEHKK